MYLLLTLLVIGITGCGKDNGDPTNSEVPEIAYFSYNSEPVTDFDPSVESSSGSMVLHNIYETLLLYDSEKDDFIGVLATDYTKSDDGMTWNFNIREGVRFHDGSELNAEAVKFSIERTKRVGKGMSFHWDPVDEINVVNDYQVEFKLKHPAPLDLISSSTYAAFIMSPTAVSAHPDDWLTEGNDAGTGPYLIESQEPGQRVVLAKFDDYWQGWGDKYFDKVIIEKHEENSTRRQLIEKGETDITLSLSPEDLESLKNSPVVDVLVLPSLENLLLHMNMESKILENKYIRQALSYAFPYDDVIKYALGNLAKRGIGPVPANMWGHGNELFQYQYDLAKAKELLAKAGYPDGGFELELTYMSAYENRRKIAELYKAELAKLNIDLKLHGITWEAQWSKARNNDPRDRQDIFLQSRWPDLNSPYSWLYNYVTEDVIFRNFNYYQNGEYDELLEEASMLSATDREQACDLFIKAQEMLVNEDIVIYAGDKECVYVVNKSFKGFTFDPAYSHVVRFYGTYRE